MKILVINGPNLNFLGIREKSVYGNQDYAYLKQLIQEKAPEIGAEVEVFQSNYEGGIIDRIQESYFDGTDALIINPGAYTHYSYAIRDALASIVVPKAEIPISDYQIYGRGLNGYLVAIDYCLAQFEKNS